jgi:hypothetical protein
MVTKSGGLVTIRLKVNILGLFHGLDSPQRGDVVEVKSYDAARYFMHGYAQPATDRELGDPYRPYRGAT